MNQSSLKKSAGIGAGTIHYSPKIEVNIHDSPIRETGIAEPDVVAPAIKHGSLHVIEKP
jgi:hypothetical protein